ncbi:MAG: 5-formyltetrahydrofolate cyclo-ligase [Rudaea sp.]|nr:5-formyltetrahydrofolate cyclo-ligase [Rudaea sp.]
MRTDLRARLRSARAQLGAAERIAAASALMSSLEQLPEFLVDARVAGYWAVGGELPLNLVPGRLRERGQSYCLPVLAPGNRLNFALWTPGGAVHANRHGIPEPDPAGNLVQPRQIDLVLMPLLGFDRRGNRLGSGGGYYDRSFAFLREMPRPTQPLLVGIGYHFQELPGMAPESWDVPLDFVATDRELIECSPRS